MDPSSFYGGDDNDEGNNLSSDEDYIYSSSTDSDTSEDSVTSEDVSDDEAQQHSGANVVAQPDWGPVQSSTRSFPFTGEEKLAVLPETDASGIKPIDIYNLILTEDIVSMIVTETNRYAQQVIDDSQLTRRSRLHAWKDTNNAEIRKYIGIVIYMGLNPKPEIALYWSKSILYADPFVPNLMTRERFELLYRFLHFTDNTAPHDDQDGLYKFTPLGDSIISRFQTVYKPGSEIVIDESMICFRGRLGIRQYVPGKSHKYGVKLYKLCTPDSYTLNFEVHTKRKHNRDGLGVTESRVVMLTEKYLNHGATLFADNYYCSKELGEYLLKNKTYLCGTVRSSRKTLTKEVTKVKLKRGEMKALENRQGVKVYNWLDKRNVLTISTVPEHSDSLVASGKKNKQNEDILKPESVLAYNKAKKGIDVADQLTYYYSPLRKTRKWYKKLALEVLTGITVTNAWVLHKKYYPQKAMSTREFRESLVFSLTNHPAEGPPRPGRSPCIVTGRRTLHSLVELDGPKRKTRKRCRGCYEKIALSEGYVVARNKARRISTYCDHCDGKPHLCLPCFTEKHSVE